MPSVSRICSPRTDDALRAMGFTNVKALYLADNIATNWRDKGYPMATGN